MKRIALVLWTFVICSSRVSAFGAVQTAIGESQVLYRLEVSYVEIYSLANGASGFFRGADVYTDVVFQVAQNHGSDVIELTSPDYRFLARSMCSKKHAGMPTVLRYFGTTTYELPDDLFTRVRGANLFVRLESYDFSTGEFQALAVCSWVYTGGGSGSYEV